MSSQRKFTFAISSPDEFLVSLDIGIDDAEVCFIVSVLQFDLGCDLAI